jgi:hypothetical protein
VSCVLSAFWTMKLTSFGSSPRTLRPSSASLSPFSVFSLYVLSSLLTSNEDLTLNFDNKGHHCHIRLRYGERPSSSRLEGCALCLLHEATLRLHCAFLPLASLRGVGGCEGWWFLRWNGGRCRYFRAFSLPFPPLIAPFPFLSS